MEQNLSQYRIFYEVAKTGNISRAAKELFISQPAISKAIGKLEDSLDTALFTRNSRGVQLTAEGQILFDHTKRAFEELASGETELKRAREFHMGHIRIGVSNTLCRYIMVSYLKNYIEQYPHVKITIESQSTTHTMNMLEQQKIDLGLVVEPRPQKNLVFMPVMEIEDIFVASPAYLDNLRLREGEDADLFQSGNIMLLDHDPPLHRRLYGSEPYRAQQSAGSDHHGSSHRVCPHRSGHRQRNQRIRKRGSGLRPSGSDQAGHPHTQKDGWIRILLQPSLRRSDYLPRIRAVT